MMSASAVTMAVFALGEIILVSAHDVAFGIIVLGILLTMTGVFGDPNLVIVGLVVSIAGVIGVAVDPESTLLVIAALIPVVGFLLFYLYRYVAYPRSKAPAQTSNANTLIGKRGRITERATARDGEVKLDRAGFDRNYQCRTEGGELEPGEVVIVIASGGGNILTVAPEDTVDPDDLEISEPTEAEGWKVFNDLQRLLHRILERK